MDKYFKNIINAEELSELDMESIKGGWTCTKFTCATHGDCNDFICGVFKDIGLQPGPDLGGE